MAQAWVDLVGLAPLGCLEVRRAVDVVHGRAGPELGARAPNGQVFGQVAGQSDISAIAGNALTESALRQLRLCLPPSRPPLMVKLSLERRSVSLTLSLTT